jgi:L-lactate utilization protein LutB
MPRTETKGPGGTVVCSACEGSGADDADDLAVICSTCGGNGYVPSEPTIHDALQTLRENEETEDARGARLSADYRSKVGLSDEPAIDLTATTPPPGRMANQTWRILEEQRQAAEDTIAECDAEIERWTKKMVDAMKTKGMCEAGQRALDGGL